MEGVRSELSLPRGVYLVEVREDRVCWVEIPNTDADRALSLDQACDRLLKPALAQLRHHQAED